MSLSPIEYRIIKSLQYKLQRISEADGYHHDVKGFAVRLDANRAVEELVPGADPPLGPPLPFLVLDVSTSPSYSYLERTNRITIDLPFVVHAFAAHDPTDDDSRLLTYLTLAADIEMAMAAAGSHDGLAADTLIIGRTITERDGNLVIAQIAGRVHLHRGFGLPNG